MRVLVRGGRVLDPASGTDGELDVLVEDGRIARIAPAIRDGADDIIDARGAWVLPGLIDIHVHLRQPGHERSETIASGTRAAAAGGITAVVCMPDTQPPVDCAAVAEHVRALAQREGLVRVYVTGTLTRGREGRELSEMGELAAAGAVAFTDDDRCVRDAAVMRHALAYAAQLRRPVVACALDPDLARGGIMREGEVSFRLGLPGIPAEAESVIVARELELARLTGAHVHIAHVSTARSVELIEQARQRGLRVSADVTPHHLMLTDRALEGYDANAKLSPPLGSEEDRQALRDALARGIIDCVASDHSPHPVETKQAELTEAPFGASGLETVAAVVLGCLVEEGVLHPLQAVRALTWAPARVMGLAGGRLREGEVADLTVFDPHARWVVEPQRWHSLGRNTPFAGWSLRGRAVAVLVGGRPVMRDGQLLG